MKCSIIVIDLKKESIDCCDLVYFEDQWCQKTLGIIVDVFRNCVEVKYFDTVLKELSTVALRSEMIEQKQLLVLSNRSIEEYDRDFYGLTNNEEIHFIRKMVNDFCHVKLDKLSNEFVLKSIKDYQQIFAFYPEFENECTLDISFIEKWLVRQDSQVEVEEGKYFSKLDDEWKPTGLPNKLYENVIKINLINQAEVKTNYNIEKYYVKSLDRYVFTKLELNNFIKEIRDERI